MVLVWVKCGLVRRKVHRRMEVKGAKDGNGYGLGYVSLVWAVT